MPRWLAGVIMALSLFVGTLHGLPSAAAGETAASPDVSADVKSFLDLLAKPDVQKWLTEQGTAGTASQTEPRDSTNQTGLFSEQITHIREHIGRVIAGLPKLPGDLKLAAEIIHVELAGYGLLKVLALVAAFAILGIVLRWAYLQGTSGLERRLEAMRFDSAGRRAGTIIVRLLWQLGAVIAFGLGSLGAFLAFAWPPLLKEIVTGYLLAALLVWIASVILHALLSPVGDRAAADAER